jgi:hypothetical protein
MLSFGANVKHILDCQEANDEVISRTKAYALSNRHKHVCPHMIPLSPITVNNYEKQNKELIDKELEQFDYIHSKLGLTYNMFPLKDAGFDYS